MFGNRLGWGISGGIVILVVGLLAMIIITDKPSRPTKLGLDPENSAALSLPVDPQKVLPSMSEAGDAGDLYRQAIKDYQARTRAYDRFADKPDLAQVGQFKAFELVVQGTKLRNMTLFAADPKQVINYQGTRDEIEALNKIGDCLMKIGTVHLNEGRMEEARKYYEAEFSMGAKLAAERVVYEEFDCGMEHMRTAAMGLTGTTQDENRVKELKDFDGQMREYMKTRITPMWQVISAIDQNIVYKHAGDVFVWAQQAKERMWRIEAILKLGRQKYDVGTAADQRASRRVARQIANDPNEDPAVRHAAKLALELRIEEYRTMGGS